jgi:hypothetical protein
MHPYTKIEFVESDLKVSRLTATKYYITVTLNAILTRSPA